MALPAPDMRAAIAIAAGMAYAQAQRQPPVIVAATPRLRGQPYVRPRGGELEIGLTMLTERPSVVSSADGLGDRLDGAVQAYWFVFLETPSGGEILFAVPSREAGEELVAAFGSRGNYCRYAYWTAYT